MASYGLNQIASNYLFVCTGHILAMLEEQDLSVAEVYEDAGIGRSVNAFPSSFVTWEHYKRLLCYLDESGLIPGVGLLVGSKTQLGDMGLLGYASHSSKTFWEGLNVGVPFAGLLGWTVRVQHRKLDPAWTELQITSDMESAPLPRAVIEQWMMVCLTGVERLMQLSSELEIGRIHFFFPYSRPHYHAVYEKTFHGCQLHFNQDFCGWRYPGHWDAINLHSADNTMSTFCARQLALLKKQVHADNGIVETVNAYLYLSSSGGFPDMTSAANHFNMSVATLRRKLKAHNTTYEQLVESIRKEMAAHLMSKSEIKSEEVAYTLGYKYPSNFHAAFKNWFGCSTREYRRSIQGINPASK